MFWCSHKVSTAAATEQTCYCWLQVQKKQKISRRSIEKESEEGSEEVEEKVEEDGAAAAAAAEEPERQ